MRLSVSPGEMSAADVEELRAQGWQDEQIHIAAQVIGYFNYINRLADGLGVADEEWMAPPKDDWLAKKGRDYR